MKITFKEELHLAIEQQCKQLNRTDTNCSKSVNLLKKLETIGDLNRLRIKFKKIN